MFALNAYGFNNFSNIIIENAGSKDWNGKYTWVENECDGDIEDNCKYSYIKEGDKKKHLFYDNGNKVWVLNQEELGNYYKSSIKSDKTPPITDWETVQGKGLNPPPSISIDSVQEFLNILLVSRREELLEELKKNLDRSDRKISICIQDITEKHAAEKIFKKWTHSFANNKIDHLICNAGILIKASPIDINLEKNREVWEKLYKTNYLSHRNIIEYALKKSEENDEILLNKDSHIAITNSIEGKIYLPTPQNYFGAYGKSKKFMKKWVNQNLRKNPIILNNNIKITMLYPSKIEGPMFVHILEKNGRRIERKPEWEVINFKYEPYKDFDRYSMDVIALRYYLAIQTNKTEEYSSRIDRIISEYFPNPFSAFLFYLSGLTKNLSLVDIPLYLILQFPWELITFSKMALNNFYIKDNIISKEDILKKEYKLQIKEANIKDDEKILYNYYITNTLILSGVGYYAFKKIRNTRFFKNKKKYNK